MLPAVMAGWPTEKPSGAGRARVVGVLRATISPVTSAATGMPSSAPGSPRTLVSASRIFTPSLPFGRSPTAVPITPGIRRRASV